MNKKSEENDYKTNKEDIPNNMLDGKGNKKDVAKLGEITKGFVEQTTKDLKVAVEIMFKSGDKKLYIWAPFKIIQIENSLYEWSEEKDCVYNIELKKKRLSCNYFYEGNPKAQRIKEGSYPQAYIYKEQLIDGKALLKRLEIAAWGVKEWEKTSKGSVMTEGNVKWVFITIIAIVAVVVVGLILKGGI